MDIERRQKLFRRRVQRQKLDVRDLGLGLQRGCIKGKSRARRNTRDVGGLGLVVEGNTKGSLFSTNEMLGKYWRLWAKSPKGMIKTGGLENRGKIGARQKGVCVVYYESRKRDLQRRLVNEGRCLFIMNR